MKNKTAIVLILAAALCMAGCGESTTSQNDTTSETTASEATETESETEPASETESEEETQTEEAQTETETEEQTDDNADEIYHNLIAIYQEAWEKQVSADQLTSHDLNYMFSYFYDSDTDKTGYYMEDFDGNGVRELVIGVNSEAVDGTQILEMYTIRDGEAYRVIQAGERDSYFVKKDNTFYNTGSDSATRTVFIQYELEGDFLSNLLQVEYNSELNADSPYFLVDGENYEPLTNSELEEYCKKLSGDVKTLELTEF